MRRIIPGLRLPAVAARLSRRQSSPCAQGRALALSARRSPRAIGRNTLWFEDGESLDQHRTVEGFLNNSTPGAHAMGQGRCALGLGAGGARTLVVFGLIERGSRLHSRNRDENAPRDGGSIRAGVMPPTHGRPSAICCRAPEWW